MNPSRRSLAAVISLIFVLPFTAIMYLGDALVGLAFAPFDFFNWITGILPGPLVTFGIDMMIDTFLALGINVANTAKTAEQAIAVIQFIVLVFVVGAVFIELMRAKRVAPDRSSGLIAGSLLGLPIVVITLSESASTLFALLNGAWLSVLFLGWGAGMALSYKRLLSGSEQMEITSEVQIEQIQVDRRSFLITLGAASATLTVIGAGLGAVLSAAERRKLLASTADSEAHLNEGPLGDPFPNAADPVMPAPGTRPEYTPVKDHYQVFIEVEPTVIREEDWILPITGLVENPLMLTLQDFREQFTPRHQYVTLSCISGRIGTSLISTTYWTGASVQDVLAKAQVLAEARYLNISSADGFHETVDLELIRSDSRIMFCYSWDGNTLPVGHGFPLRIWIPDRYGMKQPKWITSVEVTADYREGYWVERGWDEQAQVKATSVVDTVATNAGQENGGNTLIPIGGIAFAGAREISRVEVRTDDGPWQPAELRAPLSETTWVLWRYDWSFEPGDHTFEVRCSEGDGTPQIEAESEARPSGATGLHRQELNL